jgi:hypothetical protein
VPPSQIDERVVIDRTAQRNVAGFSDDVGDTVATCLTEYLSTTKTGKSVESASPAFADHPTLRDLVRLDVPASGSSEAHQNGKDKWVIDPTADKEPRKPELTDDDFFICRNTIIVFALDQKVWVHHARISLLRDIDWDSDPFKSLQFSEDAKLLVYRLVKGFNNRSEDVYDDIIKGKGKGLIFLLHGPPGLGKTLTAGMSSSVREDVSFKETMRY